MTTEANKIFDAALAFGKKMEILIEIRIIESQIKNVSEQCGSCKKWWTPDCHREWTDKRGQTHGPSATSKKCGQFDMSCSAQSSVKLAEAKIAELQTIYQSN